MTTASLGFAIDSSQAVSAKTNLDKLASSSAQAEAAAQKLGRASSAVNADLGKIAVGVDQANAMLAKLVTLSEQGNASLAKIAAGGRTAGAGLGSVASGAGASTKALNDNANAARLTSSQLLNLSRQGNDVITMFTLGVPAMQIFASQAGQVYDALESGPKGLRGSLAALAEAGKTAFAAIGGFLATPAGLATAAGAAAVAGVTAYVLSTKKDVKDLDTLLKEHDAILRGIGDTYGFIASKAKDAFASGVNGLQLASSATQAGLQIQIANQTKDLWSSVGRFVTPGRSAGGFFSPSSEFQPFADAILYLQKTVREGAPDILGFRKMVEDRWALDPNNQALTESAGKLIDLTKDAEAAARALKQLKIAQDELAKAVGPGGIPLRRGALSTEDMGAYDQYQRQLEVSRNRQNEAAWADFQRMTAKSPQEIYEAAKRQEAAKYNDNESAQERADRIRISSTMALAEAEYQLIEAHKERARALDATMDAQKLDLSLIGKTTEEAERMRFEFEHIQELREEAARNGVEIDQKEIAAIKAKADEYGKLAAAIQRATLDNDLRFEISQLSLTPSERQIASRLRGTGLGMDSPEAQAMRDIQQIQELQDGIRGFFGDFKQALLKGDDIGDALKNSILNALSKVGDKWLDEAANMLGDVVGKAFGIGGGGGLDTAASTVTRLFSAANQNIPTAGNAALDASRQAIKSIESSGNYGALGPLVNGDRAYGAYQVMGANIGPWSQSALGFKLTPSQFLANPGYQDAIFNNRFGGYMGKYGSEGAARAWFTGSPTGGGMDVLGTSADKYVSKFNSALQQVTGSTAKAAEGLGQFGSGASQIGQILSGAGGGGGSWSWLSNLTSMFGGASGAFNYMNSISPAATSFLLGGGVGLFADGTESAPPGWAWVGEKGPELMKLRGGETIRSNRISTQMAGSPMQPQRVEVHVTSDDEKFGVFVREHASGVVQEAAPAIMNSAVSRANATAPAAVGRYQQQKAGGDYRS